MRVGDSNALRKGLTKDIRAIPTEQRTRVRALLGGDCFGASRLAMTPWLRSWVSHLAGWYDSAFRDVHVR
jgi:hypothetical protein